MHAFKSYSNQKVSILSYCKMIYMYQTEIGTFHSLCSSSVNSRLHGSAASNTVQHGVRSFFDIRSAVCQL